MCGPTGTGRGSPAAALKALQADGPDAAVDALRRAAVLHAGRLACSGPCCWSAGLPSGAALLAVSSLRHRRGCTYTVYAAGG